MRPADHAPAAGYSVRAELAKTLIVVAARAGCERDCVGDRAEELPVDAGIAARRLEDGSRLEGAEDALTLRTFVFLLELYAGREDRAAWDRDVRSQIAAPATRAVDGLEAAAARRIRFVVGTAGRRLGCETEVRVDAAA